MEAPTPETLWKMIATAATAIMATCLSVLGIQYNRYQRDRRTLHELKRKMDQVDVIRKRTDDGRVGVNGLREVNERLNVMAVSLESVIERQDMAEQMGTAAHTEVLVKIGKIETNVEWIREKLEEPQRGRR